MARARRALGTRSVGHTGTLDPFAKGLLVLVVGRATRLAPFAAEWPKSYEGVIRLGVTTDTDDATGAVVATAPWTGLTPARLAEDLVYCTVAGDPMRTQVAQVLAHFFNHQTHHRGQAHGMLSSTKVAPPVLDLIYFLRDHPEVAGLR